MASLPYPRTPLSHACPSLSSASRFSFPRSPISFPLHTPYFCHPHRPTRMLVSTDADARTDRRRHTHRTTRMLVTTDADDFCWCFAVSNLYFRSAKPLLSCYQTVAFAAQDLPFHISLPLFLAISSPVFLNQRCFPVVCILWLQSLKQSLSPIII